MTGTHDNEEGRRDMPTATTASTETDIVQVSTRVPKRLRQRLKVAAAVEETSVQEIMHTALEEFLRKRGL